MGLSDIAGVLSRKFVVGFFVPSFFVVLALKLLVNRETVPGALARAGAATQVLVVGALALLIGLLLWGLHYSVVRVLEGYWLITPARPALGEIPGNEPVGRWARSRLGRRLRQHRRKILRLLAQQREAVGNRRRERWVRARQHYCEIRAQPDPSPERTKAARVLSERFPAEDKSVLPTEFGNVLRAFETHPRQRYGLDGIAVWPRIATLLSDSERAEIDETTTDVAFWVNSLVGVLLAGLLLFVERLWHPPGGVIATIALEAAILGVVSVIVVVMYRRAIIAAGRWGEPVRAAFDVHRFELYDRLGMRRPLTCEQELATGAAINRLIAFAEPLPDELRAKGPESGTQAVEAA